MEIIDRERIERGIGSPVVWHRETGSTNDDARALAMEGAQHGTVVIAEMQHAGRGRRGSVWVAPPGRTLLCSMVLRPEFAPEHWPRLTHVCALAVCQALEAIPDLPQPEIKWPNDIYLSGKKVCGILVESAFDSRGGFAIAGAGINLNLTSEDFPPELRSQATSVWLERGGQSVSREEFAIRCLNALLHRAAQAESDFGGILAECERRSFLNGRKVVLTSNGRQMTGIAAGCGPEGELLLDTESEGQVVIRSADMVRVIP